MSQDATVTPETLKTSVQIPTPTVGATVRLWDAVSLTFAGVVYTALITIVGVLVASLPWPLRAVYAVLAVAIGILCLTRLKGWALGQRFIVDTVEAALDALLPEPLDDVRVREDAERERALRRLKRWR